MLPPPTLRIFEIFASIQGEGLRQGEPTLFIRTAGCDVRCAFCDTKRAWKGGALLSVRDIRRHVARLRKQFPAGWVCLTGGEPLLQDIGPLVKALKRDGLKIQVETNGRIYRPLGADWYTVSPKPPSFEMRRQYRRLAAEVKLVVSKDLTFETVRLMRRDFPGRVPLLLQPQSRRRGSAVKGLRILKQCVRAGMGNIRLVVQAHKELGVR